MAEAQFRETPADVLRRARKRDSDRKRTAVLKAIKTMTREDVPITFAAVARQAKVSKWLVYADGMRECVEAARAQQGKRPERESRRNEVASATSLRTDLELCRQDNRALRGEVERLKNLLRVQLGEELEVEASAVLRKRADELADRNRELRIENTRLVGVVHDLTTKVGALEDDLVAVRSRLKQMMRINNDI